MQLSEGISLEELTRIAREASRALTLLDADHLERLARTCDGMTAVCRKGWGRRSPFVASGAPQLGRELAGLSRILDATRANLAVMERLRDLREGRLEYRPPHAEAKASHGND